MQTKILKPKEMKCKSKEMKCEGENAMNLCTRFVHVEILFILLNTFNFKT